MIKLQIQGYDEPFEIENLVFDYNGTLALDGKMSIRTREGLSLLHKAGFNITVLTADTLGTVTKECEGLPIEVNIFDKGNAEESKLEIVNRLGAEKTAAIGNGRNDLSMLKNANIGIAVIGMEGAYAGLMQAADILVPSIDSAIELFLKPKRIEATLRR
ncbi:HAD family hydrolase [Gudongella sp. DL1XJH-153]|uniref:HAD family hydrolase n=1 Tax=Gudongella sp. DL1XJH-153 TaxID=3409804 RepID=UPI003BB64A72